MFSLAFCALFVTVVAAGSWLCYILHSIARAADALERIADVLEDDEESEGKE